MKNLKKYLPHILIGLISGVCNGLFGAGGGSVVVPAMETFLKMDEKKAHATAILIILVMSAISSYFYIRGGFFDFKIWTPVTIGGVIGGVVGAKVLSKISGRWIKIIFGIVIVVTAVKMMF